jgi:hypothetical protein
MKAKQILWLGMGLFSICSMMYRAPQIMQAMGGTSAEAAASEGVPDASSIPAGALTGLLQAMGNKPMNIDDLRAGHGSAEQGDTPEAPPAPTADNLRLFGPSADASDEQARKLLERAAAASPANAITARGNVAKKDEAAKKPRTPTTRVVVHRTPD